MAIATISSSASVFLPARPIFFCFDLSSSSALPSEASKSAYRLQEKVIRVLDEELQVVPKYAEAVAELVRVGHGSLEARNELRHVHKAFARDVEHLLSVGLQEQLGLCLRKGLSPFAGVQRVSDAQRKHFGGGHLVSESVPDVTGLLAGNGGQHIDRERRALHSSVNPAVELRFEPADCIDGRHGGLALFRLFGRGSRGLHHSGGTSKATTELTFPFGGFWWSIGSWQQAVSWPPGQEVVLTPCCFRKDIRYRCLSKRGMRIATTTPPCDVPRTRDGGPAARTSDRVGSILETIERRYAERLTLDALARHVCRERGHVASQFRRETGFTIHRYLTRVRIQHAADLLRKGEKVEAVMLLVGYHSKKELLLAISGPHGAHARHLPGSGSLILPAATDTARRRERVRFGEERCHVHNAFVRRERRDRNLSRMSGSRSLMYLRAVRHATCCPTRLSAKSRNTADYLAVVRKLRKVGNELEGQFQFVFTLHTAGAPLRSNASFPKAKANDIIDPGDEE